MRMVGHRQGFVHRGYKPRSKRWMTTPQRERIEETIFLLKMGVALFFLILTVGMLYFY